MVVHVKLNRILDPDAHKLTARLDGLPLALATAGDYLRYNPHTFAEYLVTYEQSWQELGSIAEELHDYEGRTLYSTWNLSLSLIEAQFPEATVLLRFIAYFSNEDIRLELLRNAIDKNDQRSWRKKLKLNLKFKGVTRRLKGEASEINLPSLRRALSDELNFDKVMRRLQDYSLVESYESTGGYSLHACVHDWTLNYLNRNIGPDLAWAAFHCVATSFVWEERPLCMFENRRLLQHVERFDNIRIQQILKDDQDCRTPVDFLPIGQLFRERNKLSQAERMFRRALASSEKVFGPTHVSTLNVVYELGRLYYDQDEVAEAEQTLQRALAGCKALGSNDRLTLRVVNGLDNLYCDQGRYPESEQMYQRAMAGSEKTLGPGHP